MPTPSIQTLRADAQQVLNLDSISAVRSVVAATLANANAGTPLNPNLTTQQLWNEFYQIVTQPKSDIESIIANQLMKFMYAPPAPGGAGANHEVIYNNNGVLAGDPKFLWDDALNKLDIDGSATIDGDLTVDTSTLKVDSTNNRVGIGTASPALPLDVVGGIQVTSGSAGGLYQLAYGASASSRSWRAWNDVSANGDFQISTSTTRTGSTYSDRYRIDVTGIHEWFNTSGTAMTLNSTGLGVGVTPSAWGSNYKSVQTLLGAALAGKVDGLFLAQNCYYDGTNWVNNRASTYSARYDMNVAGNSVHAWYVYNGVFGSAGNTIPFTQAMTLDASGNLLVGTTSLIAGSASGSLNIVGANTQQIQIRNSSATAGEYWRQAVDSSNTIYILNNASTGVSITSGATSWSAVSDERLKDIIEPIGNAVAKVGSLRSVIGKYKSDSEGTRRSFLIAQDVQSVLPEAVDTTNADAFGVRYSEVIPLLVAAIKELTARVQTLEAK